MRKVIKTVEVTFDEVQAFRTLCEVLDIDRVVFSEEQLYIHKGKVCCKDKNGEYEAVDDRADLFAALRNVAQACGGNCEFRSDPYITNWEGDEHPTNGDMIRRMSNWELADFLGKFEDCRDDIFEWLISEAETDKEE